MADWKSRWRSLVSRGRDRETVLGLNEAERSASAAAEPQADEPSDSADELASDDVAAAPVDSTAGAAEERVFGRAPPPSSTTRGRRAARRSRSRGHGRRSARCGSLRSRAAGDCVAKMGSPRPSPKLLRPSRRARPGRGRVQRPPPPRARRRGRPRLARATCSRELRNTAQRLEQALADERLRRERLEREVAGLSDSDPPPVSRARDASTTGWVSPSPSALRQKYKLAIVQLGIDRFESVRDGVGARQGDDVLRSVALALESTLRQGDTIARLGSDPVFTILLPGVKRDEDVTVIADKLRLALRSPFTIGGSDLLVTASIGMALFPDDGSDTESLLQSAGLAMERAREKGGDAWDVHAPGSRARAAQRQARETALQRALVRGGLDSTGSRS